jgi:hypothetical protein
MLTQEEAVAKYLHEITVTGATYEKFTEVDIRSAVEGEVIVTVTAAGKETQNTAKAGDFVVRNHTGARELYILPPPKVAARYAKVSDTNKDGWAIYQAKGEIQAITYNGENTEFTATWGEGMQLHKGDMLCTPLPQKNEVYRIAATEFGETYRLKSS